MSPKDGDEAVLKKLEDEINSLISSTAVFLASKFADTLNPPLCLKVKKIPFAQDKRNTITKFNRHSFSSPR